MDWNEVLGIAGDSPRSNENPPANTQKRRGVHVAEASHGAENPKIMRRHCRGLQWVYMFSSDLSLDANDRLVANMGRRVLNDMPSVEFHSVQVDEIESNCRTVHTLYLASLF